MKKLLLCISLIILSILTFYLAYGYKNNQSPKTYYKVYLNDKVLGVIDSADKLNKYIDKESENIKNKYGVKNVYAPAGLKIQSISSYDESLKSVDDIFGEITKTSSLTIEAYKISIKTDKDPIVIYSISEDLFKTAVTNLIETFVGSDKYQKFLNGNQGTIVDTGSIVENVYIQDDITIKKTNVSVDEKIYTDEKELSQFLLFGKDFQSSKYMVQLGDTIAKVADENKISTEEFLISNPQFTDKTNLLHAGQTVTIAVTNPQLKVVSEEYQIVDMDNEYVTEERYDSSKFVGDDEVIQEGENGVLRVTQNVQSINGLISYIDPIDKKEIKPVINRVVLKGDKYVPNVGDTKNWKWPSIPGYTITDRFEWRTNPITHKRERHSGIDITGTGYGSPIFAANNGTIITKKYSNDYGNYIVINHNNGYWTVYAHMSRMATNISVGSTVSKGQLIGYVGSTGWATGPHIHFEVWKGCEHCRIDPFTLYR